MRRLVTNDKIRIHHYTSEPGTKNQQRLLLYIISPIEKRNHKKMALFLEERMNLLKDNAPSHESMKTMAKINALRFELHPNPRHFPGLAASDFYLFLNLKRWP